MKIEAHDRSRLAKTDQEHLALIASDADWFARSSVDVQALREAKEGPFGKLSEEAYNEFLNSLVFSQGGLASASYKPLMAELTLSDMNEVLGRFGIDTNLAADHDGFACTSPHTCTSATLSICMSNC